MTHIYASKLNIIGSDNGLSPGRRQAIIWTNAIVNWTRAKKLSEILIEIFTFSFKKMDFEKKKSSGKWWPFCLGLNHSVETPPLVDPQHSHLALFDVVTPPFVLFILLPIFRANCLYIHEWESRQIIKQAHHTSVPSDCDPQWYLLYWRSRCIFHTVCWGAVCCLWWTTSVYFGITNVCFIHKILPAFGVGPQYQHRFFIYVKNSM